jgi:hypothetical protein
MFALATRHLPEFYRRNMRGFTMADTTKLSVEKALEKLRGTETPKSRIAQLDEKIEVLDEETKRLRAARRRLEAHQRRSAKPG